MLWLPGLLPPPKTVEECNDMITMHKKAGVLIAIAALFVALLVADSPNTAPSTPQGAVEKPSSPYPVKTFVFHVEGPTNVHFTVMSNYDIRVMNLGE